MFSRRKVLFIVTTLALLGIAFAVRVGQAQKPTSAKAPSGGHAQLASSVAVVGHAVGFAETRPVRELMASVSQTDREMQEKADEKNELNTVFNRQAKHHAPAQSVSALPQGFRHQ